MHLAEEKQMHLNIEEIEKFFEEEALSAQQIELVCDYLLSQKVAVSGYEKKPGVIRQAEEEREELTREEQEYLESYLREIHEMVPRTPEESRLAAYTAPCDRGSAEAAKTGSFPGRCDPGRKCQSCRGAFGICSGRREEGRNPQRDKSFHARAFGIPAGNEKAGPQDGRPGI